MSAEKITDFQIGYLQNGKVRNKELLNKSIFIFNREKSNVLNVKLMGPGLKGMHAIKSPIHPDYLIKKW